MPLLLRRPSAETQRRLYQQDVQLGADGSIVKESSLVYILTPQLSLAEKMQTVDYFHGMRHGTPIAQTADSELDAYATEMIAVNRPYSFTVRHIKHIQARFRTRRNFRWMQRTTLAYGSVAGHYGDLGS